MNPMLSLKDDVDLGQIYFAGSTVMIPRTSSGMNVIPCFEDQLNAFIRDSR